MTRSIVRLVRYNRLPDKARYLKRSVFVVVPSCGKSLETFTRYHKQQIEAIASVLVIILINHFIN